MSGAKPAPRPETGRSPATFFVLVEDGGHAALHGTLHAVLIPRDAERFRVKERLLQMAEYARTHKNEKREYDRIYRQLHREKRKEQMKAWRERQKSGTTTKSGR